MSQGSDRATRRDYVAKVEFVEADGLKIAYERVGEGPPLVLVHGAAEDSRIWQRQLAVLADEFTVVAWDEPGAGRSSDLPEGMTLAGFADALAALVESLRARARARRRPVLGRHGGAGAVPPPPRARCDPDHDRHLRRLEGVATRATRCALGSPAPAGCSPHPRGTSTPPSPDSSPAILRRPCVPLLAAIAADVRPATLARELAIMAETDLSDLLPQIGVPTLLIWGDSDVRSPLSVARQFQEAIPDAQLVVIEGAGHMSHLERPDQVNEALREFCRANPPLVT